MNKELRAYKKQLQELLKEQKLRIKEIVKFSDGTGFRVFIKNGDIDLIKLSFLKKDIAKIFNCSKVNIRDLDELGIVISVYKDREYLKYSYVELSNKELLLGYGEEGYIIADMSKYPHLLISGLSNQGKSKMVNYMLMNIGDKADILILNGFKKDYKGFALVNGFKAIERRIGAIMDIQEERIRPLYVIIEEMQIISKNKHLQEQLKELLSIGRHFNIFVIGIIQNATKENCSFKDLFNCRCSFRQIDSSSYQVCLGTSVEKDLEQREFYYLDTQLIKGYTFSIKGDL